MVVDHRAAGRRAFGLPSGRRELIALDGVVALVLWLVLVLQVPADPFPWFGLAVVTGMSLPVAVRRLWPLPALVAVAALSLLAAALGTVREPFVAVALVAYIVAATAPHGRPAPRPVIGIVGALIIVGGVVAGSSVSLPGDTVLYALGGTLVVTAWTLGSATRERRRHADRAVRQFAAQTLAEERLRIARELHDIVAHNLGIIAVNAGVANHVVTDLPPAARTALTVIEASSRSALQEMRQMLGVLRSADTPDPTAQTSPAYGLADVGAMIERMTGAQVAIDLHTEDLEQVPESVSGSAYRIVQEALTNVVKHAAPTRCRVVLTARAAELHVEITDDGPAGSVPLLPADPGHGLVGMRERAALYGGSFVAGPRPGGGFGVRATIPFRPRSGDHTAVSADVLRPGS